ncbi:MAG: hypothetical protein M1319_02165 [Chloroflexi bacterium]|nr:hypothetical protein [Chloroflexota bacterium]
MDREQALAQGDVIKSCPTAVPRVLPHGESKLSADISEYDVIVMSQSCDLEFKKLRFVLVCPLAELPQAKELIPELKEKGRCESVRRGNVPGLHMLNKCDIKGMETDYFVVDFKTALSVPFELLETLVQGNRRTMRLLPPYREQLSQAFARFFMRVGLPVDIPGFK